MRCLVAGVAGIRGRRACVMPVGVPPRRCLQVFISPYLLSLFSSCSLPLTSITATSWNGYGMSTGTVTLHSWADGAEQDDAEPPMGTNYNSRLDHRPDFDRGAREARDAAARRGGLRSHAVGRRGSSGVVGAGGDW